MHWVQIGLMLTTEQGCIKKWQHNNAAIVKDNNVKVVIVIRKNYSRFIAKTNENRAPTITIPISKYITA